MALYVERLMRERVVWELEKMVKMLPKGRAVVEVIEGEDEKESGKENDVGCILLWDDTKEHISPASEGSTHNSKHHSYIHSNPDPKPFPPIHDMYTLFPTSPSLASQHLNQTQITADEIKTLLGLNKDTKKAVIKLHQATVKAQMWLLKLSFYES